MDKIFIIHFQPLEKYPPIMNLLRFLAKGIKGTVEVNVISSAEANGKEPLVVEGVRIHRVVSRQKQMSRKQRLMLYVQFNRLSLALLRKHRPQKVLYYETLSSFAPYCYKRWFNKKSELYIHYHEYTSIEEYNNGMILNRWLHKLERKLYTQAKWVSHTNEYRMDLFLEDLRKNIPPHTFILPNYPPASWKKTLKKKKPLAETRLGFVYVGALSMHTMYVEEFARFIKQHPDKYYWDIYSDNYSPSILALIDKLEASNINFKGGVEYDTLPEILPSYQVGVILYKGHIPNYIYNAPNKLFEYLACGLDIWFPAVMTGCLPYIRKNVYPKVIPVQFEELHTLDDHSLTDRTGLTYQPTAYFEETALEILINAISGHSLQMPPIIA